MEENKIGKRKRNKELPIELDNDEDNSHLRQIATSHNLNTEWHNESRNTPDSFCTQKNIYNSIICNSSTVINGNITINSNRVTNETIQNNQFTQNVYNYRNTNTRTTNRTNASYFNSALDQTCILM